MTKYRVYVDLVGEKNYNELEFDGQNPKDVISKLYKESTDEFLVIVPKGGKTTYFVPKDKILKITVIEN